MLATYNYIKLIHRLHYIPFESQVIFENQCGAGNENGNVQANSKV